MWTVLEANSKTYVFFVEMKISFQPCPGGHGRSFRTAHRTTRRLRFGDLARNDYANLDESRCLVYFPASSFTYAALSVFFFFATSSRVG